MKQDVLLIIPAYNEEENIEDVVDNIIENYKDYDYVVINDGSRDDTRNICLSRNYNFVDYPVNQGLTSAFRGGVYYALLNDYKYIIQYDGDGQHDPRYIRKMIEEAVAMNADVVIGSRFMNASKTFTMRMVGSRILEICIFLSTKKRICDPTSGMRLYSRKAMELVYKQKIWGPEPDTLVHMIRNGMKVIEISVEMNERKAGKSYLNISSGIKYMLYMCFSILLVESFRGKEK